jgi:hypothetical protein
MDLTNWPRRSWLGAADSSNNASSSSHHATTTSLAPFSYCAWSSIVSGKRTIQEKKLVTIISGHIGSAVQRAIFLMELIADAKQ